MKWPPLSITIIPVSFSRVPLTKFRVLSNFTSFSTTVLFQVHFPYAMPKCMRIYTEKLQIPPLVYSGLQFSPVTQSCLTLCYPMNRSTPDPLSITNSRSSLRLTSIESVMPPSHLILYRPLLFLPSIPPSVRVFSNGSTLHMRWPKYWSFNFSIIPSTEIPGLIFLWS